MFLGLIFFVVCVNPEVFCHSILLGVSCLSPLSWSSSDSSDPAFDLPPLLSPESSGSVSEVRLIITFFFFLVSLDFPLSLLSDFSVSLHFPVSLVFPLSLGFSVSLDFPVSLDFSVSLD